MPDFDVDKTVKYWLESADYDMGVAEAMYEKKKYPYALFMGHLALEKMLKASVVKTTSAHAPYTHSLPILAGKLNIKIPQRTIKSLVRFMEFHLEARYPDEQKKFYKKCTQQFTKRKLEGMKKIFIWLKNRL